MDKKIVIELAENDAVLDPKVHDVIADFLTRVFNHDIDEVLITNESELWDFVTCVLPESIDIDGLSSDEIYGIAEQIMSRRFREMYHIEVSPFDSLVTVAEKINSAKVN